MLRVECPPRRNIGTDKVDRMRVDSGKQEGEGTPRAETTKRLAEIDKLIDAGRADIDARIDRANLLNLLDRRTEARDHLIEILKSDPANFRALNELGNLLSSMGYVAAACHVYKEAVDQHPENPTGHINLANLLLQGGSLQEARTLYERVLSRQPLHPQANQGIGAVLSAAGDREGAKRHFEIGFRGRAVTALPYRGSATPVALLKLVSSGEGNIPTASLIDDRIYATTVVVADYCENLAPMPHHQVIFNTIGDADICVPALKRAAAIVRASGAPVINDPLAVTRTGRACNAARMSRLSCVRAPRIVEAPQALLASDDGPSALKGLGFTYPVLLRSPGFHTGRNFVLVESDDELRPAAAGLPGAEVLVIAYLDARGRDGNARKYRAMIVGGRIYPLHLAVSQHWKVHYFTADMAENPEHRREDGAFLEDMPRVIGSRAMAGLDAIRETLGLDYAGIDFGLDINGDVLLFEANATMVVNPPDPGEQWDYRRQSVRRILNAVNEMILRKATRKCLTVAGIGGEA